MNCQDNFVVYVANNNCKYSLAVSLLANAHRYRLKTTVPLPREQPHNGQDERLAYVLYIRPNHRDILEMCTLSSLL